MTSVFFSYAREDARLVDVACQLICAAGMGVYVDTHSLQYGLDWRTQIEEAISSAGRMFLFWSARASRSRWVLFEVQAAHRHKTPVVPILLDDSPLPVKLRFLHAVTGVAAILEGYAGRVAESTQPNPTAATPKPSPSQKFIARNRPPRCVIEYDVSPLATSSLSPHHIDLFRKLVESGNSAA